MLIEVITFSVRGDAAGFDRINARYQEDVAYQTPGLARRTVGRGDDGLWVDVRLWSGDDVPTMAGDPVVIGEWNTSISVVSSAVFHAL